VLLSEAPLNPRTNRETMSSIMFEQLGVQQLLIQLQAVLSLYANDLTTGMFLDIGDGVSYTVPIFSGFAIPHAMMRVNFAGRDVTTYLATLLTERGYNFVSASDLEDVRLVKEALSYVSMDFEEELRQATRDRKRRRTSQTTSAASHTEETVFNLPKGTSVTLGSERFQCSEALFKPHLAGKNLPGIVDMVRHSICKCDMDLRKTFYGSIVLSGGSTMLLFLDGRLEKELRATCNSSMQHLVKVVAPQDRISSVWKGGAKVATLPCFQRSWILRADYLREGPFIVHKCSSVWASGEACT